jgi:peptidoglycan L-alanyl-D-glutamate endopeptidase CwlK
MEYTKRTLENLGSLHPKVRVAAERFLAACEPILAPFGASVEVISGTRSWAAQAALYAQGRTKPGKVVTKARPGSSYHNYGLAFDLGLFKGGKYLDSSNPALAEKIYKKLGELAVSMGIEWAGNWKTFKESPHFQITGGRSLSQLKSALIAANYDIKKLP